MKGKYLKKLIDERAKLIDNHFGEFYLEMIKCKEGIDWYNKNIKKIDRKIVEIANSILSNKEYKLKTVSQVFENEFIVNTYLNAKTGARLENN